MLRKTCLIFLLCMSQIVLAQSQRIAVSEIIESYNSINFNRTIALSDQALDQYANYLPEELVVIYKYRGFAFFSLGQRNQARAAFVSALSLDHNLQLDKITVSPKIIEFFDAIKEETHAGRSDLQGTLQSGQVRYLKIKSKGPAAALRSVFLPGWGQIYKDEPTKGYVLIGAFALNTIGLTYSLFKEEEYKDAYLKSVFQDEIDSNYNNYNSWYKARKALTYSGILIWAYAFADALWGREPVVENGLSVRPVRNGLALVYTF